MKLEEATAVLRPRGAWEAVDLGCAMARRHWGALMRGWLTVAVPLWALIILICHQSPGWALFFIAWTKPVLTRQPVFFMSRALFGQPPHAKEFWRDWRINFRGILASLTVKRLASQRPFRLPVLMLEGQQGPAYVQRVSVLSAHGGGNASGLTLVAGLLELSVFAAVAFMITTVVLTMNAEWLDSLRYFFQDGYQLPDLVWWMAIASEMAAIALVEPFYAAAGFALYINSRTHLEGWDIEVAFRRMSARLTPAATPALILLGALLPLLLMASGSRARAQETDASNPRQVVEEILRDPAFELEKKIVRKKKTEVSENDKDPDLSSAPSGAPATAAGAAFGYVILAAAVLVVLFLLWRHRHVLRRSRAGGDEKRPGPRVVMGLEVAPESLPEDIQRVAWNEYLAGRPLEALRLLYRGALAWLVNRAGLPVHESDTEGDCLRHSQQVPDTQRVSFFTALTAAWVNCAYADLPPGAGPMKHLCDHWPFSLREPPPRSGNGTAAAGTAAWLLLPLAALLGTGCDQNGQYETREEIVGYKGAARYNPWLAAERFLSRTGTPAQTLPMLGDLPATSATIFLPLDSVSSRGEARTLLRWALTGGHLIVACTGTSRFHNDYDGEESGTIDKNAPLLQELRVKASAEKPSGTSEVDLDGATYTLQNYDRGAALDVTSRPGISVLAGTREAATVASFTHGIGRITLLGGATALRNRYLKEDDHAAILQGLVALEHTDHVIFVSKSEVNLWDMLRRYAWMPVIALLVLIALWLWRHLPRFGQAVPASETGLRHFGTQLDEAGHFLSERAGPGALLAPARRAVMTAAAHRGLHPDAPDFMDQLAARSGLSPAEVSAALHDTTDKNLVTSAAALQKLQQSIGPLH